MSLTAVYGLNKQASGATAWDGPLNGDLDIIDTELARPRIVFNSPTVGATTTCDLSLARVFVFTVSQATTLAFSNVPSSSFAVRIRLLITNGSAFVVTFPGSVTWLPGTAPKLKASGVDEIELVTKDGGTTWFAAPRGAANIGIVAAAGGGSVFVSNSGLTVSGSNDVQFSPTFNSPANDLTALRVSVTDTASAAGAKLIAANLGATTVFKVPKEGGVITQGTVLATNATRGFAYLPTCAGAPSGVPNAETGCAAMVYDTTNNKIWFYNGAWRGVVVA